MITCIIILVSPITRKRQTCEGRIAQPSTFSTPSSFLGVGSRQKSIIDVCMSVRSYTCIGGTALVKVSLHTVHILKRFELLNIRSSLRKLNLGNACYHSVQSLLSYRFPSKNLRIKIYKNLM